MCHKEGGLQNRLIAAPCCLTANRREMCATPVSSPTCLLCLLVQIVGPLFCTAVMPLATPVPLPNAAANTIPGPALLTAAHTAPGPVWFVAAVHDYVTLLR